MLPYYYYGLSSFSSYVVGESREVIHVRKKDMMRFLSCLPLLAYHCLLFTSEASSVFIEKAWPLRASSTPQPTRSLCKDRLKIKRTY